MKKSNENLKSVIVLTVICLVVTALLAVTNNFTAPVIEESRAAKVQNSLRSVFPNMTSLREVEVPDGAPSTVKAVYLIKDKEYDSECCAVVLGTMSAYSSAEMGITVGISPEGEIIGIKITSYMESKDFGRDTYPNNYLGTNAETIDQVDSFAGVTYSSTAFRNALKDALAASLLVKGDDLR